MGQYGTCGLCPYAFHTKLFMTSLILLLIFFWYVGRSVKFVRALLSKALSSMTFSSRHIIEEKAVSEGFSIKQSRPIFNHSQCARNLVNVLARLL